MDSILLCILNIFICFMGNLCNFIIDCFGSEVVDKVVFEYELEWLKEEIIIVEYEWVKGNVEFSKGDDIIMFLINEDNVMDEEEKKVF